MREFCFKFGVLGYNSKSVCCVAMHPSPPSLTTPARPRDRWQKQKTHDSKVDHRLLDDGRMMPSCSICSSSLHVVARWSPARRRGLLNMGGPIVTMWWVTVCCTSSSKLLGFVSSGKADRIEPNEHASKFGVDGVRTASQCSRKVGVPAVQVFLLLFQYFSIRANQLHFWLRGLASGPSVGESAWQLQLECFFQLQWVHL